MKKRIVCLLLVFCLIFAMLPSMTVESDAAIGSILKIGFKLCKSVVKGTIVTCKNASYYKGNVGKAVLGQFKNIGADLTGLDIGEDYGDGEGEQQPSQDAITAAAFEEIKESMQLISSKLDETNNAIYQLESTVSSGVQELSSQLSELYNEINKLGSTVTNAAQLNRYYTYLTEFFAFFNQYYEGISYYDEQLAYAMRGNRSEAYVKNLFDQFYHLENVEYTGNLHSAVTKLGKYIRGEYVSADGGSVVDVLSQYYIQAYKLVHTGCTDAEARKAAATAIEDMVGYIYYAYCTGVYYEDAVLMYQSSYMERAGIEEYTTDFGTCISVEQVDDRYLSVSEDALHTAGALLGSLLENYPDGKLETPYFLTGRTSTGITRRLSLDGFSMYLKQGKQIAYLPDVATGLSDYFSDDLKDALSGITTYSLEGGNQVEGGSLKLYDGNRLETGSSYGTVNLLVSVLDEAIVTIPVTAQETQTIGGMSVPGEGTEDFPWIIDNDTDLWRMRYAPNDHYLLVCDISLNYYGYNNWDSFDFGGVLDGNGYTISNISTSNSGLFNTLTGTVRNLTIKNFGVNLNVSNPGNHATAYAGAIAGTVTGNGLIFRCRAVDGSVSASASSPAVNGFSGFSHAYAGGIAGYVTENATIRSCAAEDVKLSASAGSGQGVGGIVGNLYGGTVSDCFVNVDDPNVTFNATMVGGIVGSAQNKFTIHDAVIAIKSNPFKGVRSGLVLGYSVNGSTAEGYKGVEVSGDFKLIDRTEGWDWSASSPTYTLSWYGIIQSDADANKNVFSADCTIGYYEPIAHAEENPNYTEGSDEPPFIFVLDYPNTSFLEEFADDYRDYAKKDANGVRNGDGTLDFKPLTSNVEQLKIKTGYESGQCFDASGWRLVYSDEAGTYSWPAGGFSLSIAGQDYDVPLTEDTRVTFTMGGITKTYDLHISQRHTWVEMVVTAPTCTGTGESMMLCVDCGATKDIKTIPALGHKPVIDPAVSPSCKGDGLSEGSHCGYCGEVLTKQQIIAATDDHGHTIVKGYPATCTTPGLTDQDWCEGCGLVHQAATVIPATGHSMKGYTIIESTCSNAGVVQEKCEICGEYGDFKAIEALGHTWTATVVEPTHTEIGYTVYQCTSCGESYQSDYIAPIGHTFGSSTVTKAATCTSEGILTYSCSCGNSHTVSIPKTEHELVSKVTAPTCTDFGYTTHSCKHCDYSYIEAYTAPHHTGEVQWVCTEKYHTSSYSCCGQADGSREVHDWENGICHTCGYICAHTGGTATCCEQAVCELCGMHYGELDSDNHIHLEHTSAKSPTESDGGNIEYWQCADCSKYFSDRSAENALNSTDISLEKLPADYTWLLLWIIPVVLNVGVLALLLAATLKRKKGATQHV